MAYRLPRDPQVLAAVCRRYRVRKLSLFGSHLKGTAGPDSDFDLLVEFDPDASPSLLDMAKIEIELSALLGGDSVDARTAEDLSRYFRDDVVREAETQYAAAAADHEEGAPTQNAKAAAGRCRISLHESAWIRAHHPAKSARAIAPYAGYSPPPWMYFKGESASRDSSFARCSLVLSIIHVSGAIA